MKTNCSQFSFEYILLGISVSQFFDSLYNYKTRNVIVLKYFLYISLKNTFFYFFKNFLLLQLKCKKKKNRNIMYQMKLTDVFTKAECSGGFIYFYFQRVFSL